MATIINDVNDLQDMDLDLAGDYELGNNIDASATVGWNGGLGFEPVGTGIASGPEATKFTGTFDGKGFTISGLFINRPATDEIGLFGWTYDAIIKNVALTNVNITGDGYVGALVGYAEGGTGQEIDNCSSTGSINGDDEIGGLLGGIGTTGGITGTLANSYSSATVGGDDYCGGLIGLSVNAEISECYATGDVTAIDDYVGGLIGYSSGDTIGQCYARGDVTGDRYIGGLIGYISASTLDDCYSTGIPTGNTNVGGLIGYATGETVNDCFWDIQTSGEAASDGGTGKTTAQMKQIATFPTWDIAESSVDLASGYPYLTLGGSHVWYIFGPIPVVAASPRTTVDVEDIVSLQAIRNIEMAARGRFYTDEEGNAVYKSRYGRNP